MISVYLRIFHRAARFHPLFTEMLHNYSRTQKYTYVHTCSTITTSIYTQLISVPRFVFLTRHPSFHLIFFLFLFFFLFLSFPPFRNITFFYPSVTLLSARFVITYSSLSLAHTPFPLSFLLCFHSHLSHSPLSLRSSLYLSISPLPLLPFLFIYLYFLSFLFYITIFYSFHHYTNVSSLLSSYPSIIFSIYPSIVISIILSISFHSFHSSHYLSLLPSQSASLSHRHLLKHKLTHTRTTLQCNSNLYI